VTRNRPGSFKTAEYQCIPDILCEIHKGREKKESNRNRKHKPLPGLFGKKTEIVSQGFLKFAVRGYREK
jgi:hypothetical protein